MNTSVALLAAALLAMAACTAGPGGQPPQTLEGREFLSTQVTRDGADRPLLDGTRIRLSFANAGIGASAGCNSLSGPYTIAAGQLIVEEVATTDMGCDPARHEQDRWLADFLSSKPTVRLDGTELVLDAGADVVRFEDREVAEPDVPLVGARWTLESIARGDTVSSVPGTVEAPVLQFAADGRVTLTTGCNDGFATYAVEGAHMRLSAIGTTKKACLGEGGDVEALVLGVLSAENLTFWIDGTLLKVQAGESRLEYRATTPTP